MDFDERKAAAMAALASSSPDKSPKGSLDAPIAPLVTLLNRHPSLFTTSSCSGRITLLSHPNTHSRKKAGGGRWLLASHDPADLDAVATLLFGPAATSPLCTDGPLVFRFEPLIIALECRDVDTAQWIVSKAISCGFRESGITNLAKRIMVAVRCSIRMEVPLGDKGKILVMPDYVRYLTMVANEKMEANKRRTEGLYRMLLREELPKPMTSKLDTCVIDSVCRDDIALSDGLDKHDAMAVVAIRKDEEIQAPSSSIIPGLSECKEKENGEKGNILDYVGFKKDKLFRLDARKIEITGQSIENLFLWGHSTCLLNNTDHAFIIFGGFGGIGRHARRNDTLVFDPESGLLRVLDAKGPPSPRVGHTCSGIGDKFYVIGGRCGPSETLDDVWVLDMMDLQWRSLKCTGSIFHPRHRHAAAVFGTYIYVFGGLSSDVIYSCMHVLDTKTMCWSEVIGKGEWPCARHSHSLVAYGSQLFLFGGYDGERALGDIYSFDVESLVWKKEECAGRAPIPRFSHCSFIYQNYLGILGGCPLKQEHQVIALLDLTIWEWKHVRVGSVGKDLWIRSSVNIVADDLVVVGGGASCYAFGTKFCSPMKISLLNIAAGFSCDGKKDQFTRVFNVTSNSIRDGVGELSSTKCDGMKNASFQTLEETPFDGHTGNHENLRVEANNHLETKLLVLQVDKKYAKFGKDILKRFGWLDLERKVVSNTGGSQVCFPVTSAFFEKWRLHAATTSEEICEDHLSESFRLTGLKVNEISLYEALTLLLSCGGFVISDDKPLIKKASKSPQKVMQDAVSSLVIERGLPEQLLQQLPTRWERLGDMVVLPVTSFRDVSWETIGEELWFTVANSLKARRLARQGRVLSAGTRDSTLELLVGDSGWVSHHENGIAYSFDATKCMFSAGNLSEKLRMSRLDCRNEVVVDLFAGIGYFVLPFLVKSKAKLVYACEWNPHALEALRHNILINAVADRCIVLEGDNRISAPRNIADRVCLGLLPSSEGSWVAAVCALKEEGGILHIHGNVNDSEEQTWSQYVVQSIGSIAKSEGRHWDISIEHLERVKWYGPHIRHIVADVRCKELF